LYIFQFPAITGRRIAPLPCFVFSVFLCVLCVK
jgi:hypothetical protein